MDKKAKSKIINTIYQLSAILILLAAIIYSFDVVVARYAMAVGVAGFAITTFLTPYPGKSIRGKRMFNIQIFAVLLMAVATFLMFRDYKGWVVILFVAALQTLYCAIILPRIYNKEKENKE